MRTATVLLIGLLIGAGAGIIVGHVLEHDAITCESYLWGRYCPDPSHRTPTPQQPPTLPPEDPSPFPLMPSHDTDDRFEPIPSH